MQHPTLPTAEQQQVARPDLGGFGGLQPTTEDRPTTLNSDQRPRRASAVATGLAAVLTLTACGAGSGQQTPPTRPAVAQPCPTGLAGLPHNPVIAATATSAEPRPALPGAVVQELAVLATRDDACVTLVDPDGKAVALSLTPYRMPGQVEQGPRRQVQERAAVAAVQDVVGRLAAQSPGMDLRALLTAATRHHPRPTTMFLLSSGVSTADPTDIRRIGWDSDGAVVGGRLRETQWLPDLQGWTVRFVGIGDVAGAQPVLTDPVRERLIAFWLGICRSSHAEQCLADREYVGHAAPTSANVMPVVPPPTVRVDDAATWLPASTLFAVGRAEVGPEADRVLRSVADRLVSGNRTVSIVGHTDASTGSDDVNLPLSAARARAVRDRLVQLGVPPARIVAAVGVGSRQSDPDAERADPRLIDLHRSVEIRFEPR